MSDVNAAPGWYPDGQGSNRYWDGQQWTSHIQAAGPAGAVYAGFWIRFLGLLIDSIILAVPLSIVALIALWPQFSAANPNPDVEDLVGPLLVIVLASFLIQAAYFIIGIHKFGRTVGGQVVGIRCVNAEGTHPTWGASTIRYGVVLGFGLAQQIPVIGLFAFVGYLLNYLWMLWDPNKQCLMDKAAGTYVVKANSLPVVA